MGISRNIMAFRMILVMIIIVIITSFVIISCILLYDPMSSVLILFSFAHRKQVTRLKDLRLDIRWWDRRRRVSSALILMVASSSFRIMIEEKRGKDPSDRIDTFGQVLSSLQNLEWHLIDTFLNSSHHEFQSIDPFIEGLEPLILCHDLGQEDFETNSRVVSDALQNSTGLL